MYAGLTISDKTALLDAQKNGHTYIYLNHDGFRTVYNVNLALAQIAEMESAEKPLTWNKRINQMTVEEKAKHLEPVCIKGIAGADFTTCRFEKDCSECWTEYLNSPYTEGATK